MEKLVHYSHEKHPLILTQLRQQDEGDHQKSNCYGCHKPTLPEPTYTCKECNIFLHKQCAELPRTIAHPGHEEHPMMLLWRSARFNCEACGTDEEQQSYICCTCSFWIHRSCALLPKINYHKGHDHPLSLAYCLPSEYQKYEIPCDICRKEKPVQNWVYYCAPCRYFVHLKCMTTDRFNLVIEGPEPKNSFVQNTSSVILPTNIFIRIISLVMEKQKGKQIKEFGQMEVKPHEHPLIYFRLQKDQELFCSRCTEPIISSCYNCAKCNYSIHLTCAQIPDELQHPSHKFSTLKLFSHPHIWDIKKCNVCKLDCNGSFYKCSYCDFHIDIKCAFLPDIISHKSHEHPLVRIRVHEINKRCNGCGSCGDEKYIFTCTDGCDFYLDYACVFLPESFKHRWDKHLLILSFPPFTDHPYEFYCEICEQEIHPRFWQYHCGECDQSFHPNCIPTLGESRNIVFGQIVNVSGHEHPIASVPEGDLHASCSSCNVSLYGKRAFKCSTCRYYKCFKCVG